MGPEGLYGLWSPPRRAESGRSIASIRRGESAGRVFFGGRAVGRGRFVSSLTSLWRKHETDRTSPWIGIGGRRDAGGVAQRAGAAPSARGRAGEADRGAH